jgi:hypothetical protein
LQVMDKAMRSFGMPVGPITLCGKWKDSKRIIGICRYIHYP